MTSLPKVPVLPPQVQLAWKIGKILVPILVVLFLVLRLKSVTHERDDLRTWQADTVSVVRAETPVDRRKTVTAATAADEIRWLGREYRTHAEALRIQSERLVVAAGNAKAARNGAAEARKRAQESQKALEGTRKALRDPNRTTGLTASEWGKL